MKNIRYLLIGMFCGVIFSITLIFFGNFEHFYFYGKRYAKTQSLIELLNSARKFHDEHPSQDIIYKDKLNSPHFLEQAGSFYYSIKNKDIILSNSDHLIWLHQDDNSKWKCQISGKLIYLPTECRM